MKKIVCELCEGTEFTKEGGFFICQGCGTKYSLEEAKGMMKEVEGTAPVATGVPVTSVPMGNPNQQQIDNLMLLATNAYTASNNEETEKYCNKAIEYDAMCYKAWFLKAKAIGWSSTLQKPRIAEAAHSFKQAVDFAPDEEKESLTSEAVEELKRLGLACISLRKNRFSKYPDKEELAGFVSDIKPLIEGMAVLLSKGAEIAQLNALEGSVLGNLANSPAIAIFTTVAKAKKAGIPGAYFSQIATMMADAAYAGYQTVCAEYRNNSRSNVRWRKCINNADNCDTLMGMAINASDDDDEADIDRYKKRIEITEGPMNWQGDTLILADSAKANRRKSVSEYRQKISEIEKKIQEKKAEEAKKAEEEKQARIKAYWEAHADEKAALDSEKKELEEKKTRLTVEIADLDSQIVAAMPTGKVPSEDETDKLKEQIKDLENQRAKLGVFAGKQKKQIGEEIASLNGRIDSLKGKVEEEKKERKAEADKKAAPLKEKKAELQSQLDAATKRINAIDAALTKDPEA